MEFIAEKGGQTMIDREKVIAAGSCEKWGYHPSACKTCPFGYSEKLIINETEYYGCNREKWQHDALVLLKEQDAVESDTDSEGND